MQEFFVLGSSRFASGSSRLNKTLGKCKSFLFEGRPDLHRDLPDLKNSCNPRVFCFWSNPECIGTFLTCKMTNPLLYWVCLFFLFFL